MNDHPAVLRTFNRLLPVPSLLLIPLLLIPVLLIPAGCNVLTGVAAMTPKYMDAKYKGLANQSCGVMVWADRGIAIDWPSIQLDMGGALQSKLQASKADELKGATWPAQAASVVRFQREHPEIEAMDITEVAPKLHVSRLLYIEVQEFHTRSETAVELYRGAVTANLKILEIADGKAKVAYEEDGIRVVFPKKSPPEGTLDGQDYAFYMGTIDTFTDVIVDVLTRHEVQDFE